MHRTRLLLSALALGFAALACGDAEPAEEPAAMPFDGAASEHDAEAPPALTLPADAPTVAFLGDSLGAGLHLAAHQAFPAVLQRRFAEQGLPFELVSSCESGRTTSGGRTALAWVLRSEPALLVVELGANDGLRGVPLEEVEANLRAILEDARAAAVDVLLLGMLLPSNYGDYGAGFDALYPALAEEYGVRFVPAWMQGVGGEPEMNLEDGIHPTPEGHERLADNMQDALRDALSELGTGAD